MTVLSQQMSGLTDSGLAANLQRITYGQRTTASVNELFPTSANPRGPRQSNAKLMRRHC